jgi:hypothetical protein
MLPDFAALHPGYKFSPSLRAPAKQSMAQQAEAWIASSLTLLAMTEKAESALHGGQPP